MKTTKTKVLMIDDQELVVELIRDLLLDASDIEFHSETNADAAVNRARKLVPDVILQDIGMPGRDGFALLNEYRRVPDLSDVPVIVLSGHEDPRSKSRAFHEGADDYMVKGTDAVELLARIRHHAERRRGVIEQRRAYSRLQKAEHDLRNANLELERANHELGEDKEHFQHDAEMQRERLDRITTLGAELNQYHDLDLLMERILLESRRACLAESGAVFLLHGDQLRCDYVQNDVAEARIAAGEKLVIPRTSLPVNLRSISGSVAITGNGVRVEDAYDIPKNRDFAFDTTRDEGLGYRTRAVLSLPLRTSSEKTLGVLQLANPHHESGPQRVFTDEDEHIMEHFAALATVALERAHLTRSLVMRMITMAEVRDPTETGPHVNRVAGYALEIYDGWAERNRIGEGQRHRERDHLRIAAMLHDVGKVGIPDAILKKPDRLDDHEFAVMQQHTVIGARLFRGLRTDFDDVAAEVAMHHHERWDGRGYPGHVNTREDSSVPREPIRQGLVAEEIPLFARMVAIADVFDALSTHRVYKEAWPEDKVVDLIRSEAGGHFDPELVDIFVERIDRVMRIRDRYT